MKKLLFSLLILISISMYNCKKDSVAPETKEKMLTDGSSKTWKVSARTINGVADSIKNCELDDRTTFNINKTVSFDPGAIKCSAFDFSSSNQWGFNTNQDTLYYFTSYTVSGVSYSSKFGFKVIGLTDSQGIISSTNSYSGISVTTQTTIVPQ